MTSIAARVPVSRAALAALTALALATLPRRAVAAPASVAPPREDAAAAGPEAPGTDTPPDTASPPDATGPTAPAEVDPAADPSGSPAGDRSADPSADPAGDADVDSDAASPESPEVSDDAAPIDTGTLDDRDTATEPDAPEPAPTETEPTPDDVASTDDELPELSTLQTAGWWTLFGAFAVGTTAGVFAGLAERQEDRALRLATLFDSTTAMQPIYADYESQYERYLRRGRAFERTAIGLGAVTGAVLVAGIVLFAVDASRRRAGGRDSRRARLTPGLGGWKVQF